MSKCTSDHPRFKFHFFSKKKNSLFIYFHDSKGNARLNFLYRKQIFLNFKTKKLLVTLMIQCHFDYTCSFWYPGLSQSLCNKLQITQNKVIRFVLKLCPRSRIRSHVFRSLGWLPVSLFKCKMSILALLDVYNEKLLSVVTWYR